jgi:hypothetical protein
MQVRSACDNNDLPGRSAEIATVKSCTTEINGQAKNTKLTGVIAATTRRKDSLERPNLRRTKYSHIFTFFPTYQLRTRQRIQRL